MFYQILLSPQVTQYPIITFNHGIMELPRELSNDLRLRKEQESVYTSQNDSLAPSSLAKKKMFLIPTKNSWKKEITLFRAALFGMKTRVFPKLFVNDCFWKHFFACNLPQTPSNLISLPILVTLRPFTQF